jgi:RNA polymerase sigma factor (sigma-70 family)
MPYVSSASLVSLGARVRRAQEGDQRALDSLVRSFQSMAIGYATSLLGDAHHAEDVAQEAFVEVFRRLASLKVPEAFPSLLQALIRKHCDRLTRRRSLATTSLEHASATAISSKDPMHQVQLAAKREMIQQAVRELPEPEREVVLLFYVGGQSQLEIADTLGLPVSTVKSRLHEARVRLKRKMWYLDEENLPEERSTRQAGFRKEIVKKPYIPDPEGKIVVKRRYLKESG